MFHLYFMPFEGQFIFKSLNYSEIVIMCVHALSCHFKHTDTYSRTHTQTHSGHCKRENVANGANLEASSVLKVTYNMESLVKVVIALNLCMRVHVPTYVHVCVCVCLENNNADIFSYTRVQ